MQINQGLESVFSRNESNAFDTLQLIKHERTRVHFCFAQMKKIVVFSRLSIYTSSFDLERIRTSITRYHVSLPWEGILHNNKARKEEKYFQFINFMPDPNAQSHLMNHKGVKTS